MSPSYCKQLGHWRVSKEIIGNGTTSTVHLATHSTVHTLRAAVKVVSRTGLLIKADGDPTALHLADAVIHREVLLMKLAAHERILKLYDFVGHGDLVYMVLEHAPNKTLFDLFRAHPAFLPIPLVTHLFSQLMHALDHIHSLHIVHRDIKLENVFLFGPDIKDILQSDYSHTRKHRHFLPHSPKHAHNSLRDAPPPPYSSLMLKLGDFGLSHTQSPAALSTVYHGSPHYQAPELWARVPHLAFPTDMWSAGVVLYALVSRRLPFDEAELEEWGGVFCRGYGPEKGHAETVHAPEGLHEKHTGKDRPAHPFGPRPGTRAYMPYNAVETMTPAIERLLQHLFAFEPVARPTAREVLDDPFFRGTEFTPPNGDVSVLQDKNRKRHSGRPFASSQQHGDLWNLEPVSPMNLYDPHTLYDIATLCSPPSTHVAPASFRGSSFERRVQKRLDSWEDCIEKVWAGILRTWAPYDGDDAEMEVCKSAERAWDKDRAVGKEKTALAKNKKGDWTEKTAWSKSLGRIRGADVRGHLASLGHRGHGGQRGHGEQPEHTPQTARQGPGSHGGTKTTILKPKYGASLSFRSLRIKTEHKAEFKSVTAHTLSPPSPPSPSFESRPHVTSPISKPLTLQPRASAASTLQSSPSPLRHKRSFRTLRIKTSDANLTADATSPVTPQTPIRSPLQSPLAQHHLPFRNDAASTIRARQDAVLPLATPYDAASTLQTRHDVILRCAYELGLGTQELRAFAEEAGRIVRDAREGTKGSSSDGAVGGIDDCVADAGGNGNATTPTEGSSSSTGSSSTATTLVPENSEGGQNLKSGVRTPSTDVPIVKLVDIGVGRTGKLDADVPVDVDVDVNVDVEVDADAVTFDVDSQADLRWISRWI